MVSRFQHMPTRPGRAVSGIAVFVWMAGACAPATHDSKAGLAGNDSSDSTVESGTGVDSSGGPDTAPPDKVDCDELEPWTYVAAGHQQSCGVHADGCAECWGAGAPGDSSYTWQGEDRPPAGEYRSIHMLDFTSWGYGQHTCGILEDGSVSCFGDDEFGELDVPPGNYAHVAVTAYQTFTIAADGALDWSGIGSALERPGGSFIRVDAVDDSTLVLAADGGLFEYAGSASLVYSKPGPYTTMSLGGGEGRFVCAATTSGAVECWNEAGLGGDAFDKFAAAAPGVGVVDVCALQIAGLACALDEGGFVTCWSSYDGEPVVEDAPTDSGYIQLACGAAHACALTAGGAIKCWGTDVYGETVPPS